MHTGGGVRGGIKVYPPSKILAKLVNKNAIKHQKGVPSQKNCQNHYKPSLPKFGKISWTLPLDFQTVCIYVLGYLQKFGSRRLPRLFLIYKNFIFSGRKLESLECLVSVYFILQHRNTNKNKNMHQS
jgi:hypothetical protein